MSRKPVSVEIVADGNERFIVLTYANGDTVRRKVDPDSKPTRRPRRPPARLNLPERRALRSDEDR